MRTALSGPVTPLCAAAWLALNGCNQVAAAEARFAHCPPFLPPLGLKISAIKLELRRRALCSALCFASLQASLHSRYIPRLQTHPQPGPVTPFLPLLGFVSAVANFKLGGVLGAMRLYFTTFEQELLLFVVLRYSVLVKKCFLVTDLRNKDLRHRPL